MNAKRELLKMHHSALHWTSGATSSTNNAHQGAQFKPRLLKLEWRWRKRDQSSSYLVSAMIYTIVVLTEHSVIGVWTGRAVLVAWEVVEYTKTVCALLWAAQPSNDWANVLVDEVGDWSKIV
jgi:hypothetical protein